MSSGACAMAGGPSPTRETVAVRPCSPSWRACSEPTARHARRQGLHVRTCMRDGERSEPSMIKLRTRRRRALISRSICRSQPPSGPSASILSKSSVGTAGAGTRAPESVLPTVAACAKEFAPIADEAGPAPRTASVGVAPVALPSRSEDKSMPPTLSGRPRAFAHLDPYCLVSLDTPPPLRHPPRAQFGTSETAMQVV